MGFTSHAIDTVSNDAQVMRQAFGSLIGSTGGLVATGDLQLTQKGTPNMSVQVAAGSCWVPGFPAGGINPYFFNNSATYERSIVASGSEPRVDTIVVQMLDKAYEGSQAEPVIEALKGVEATGTTLANLKGIATVPSACLVLGYVFVEKGASSIVTVDIKNVATVVGLARQSWGYVSGAGAIEAGSGDFTVTKISTGRYAVVWRQVRGAAPYLCDASAPGVTIGAAQVSTINEEEVHIEIYEWTGAAFKLENRPFSFNVMAGS
jgi:hypothetical protein